jgi:hypothetical protein
MGMREVFISKQEKERDPRHWMGNANDSPNFCGRQGKVDMEEMRHRYAKMI